MEREREQRESLSILVRELRLSQGKRETEQEREKEKERGSMGVRKGQCVRERVCEKWGERGGESELLGDLVGV